jgi:GLPGLI family protein
MKKLPLLLSILPLAALAQTRQGTVVYERKIDMYRHIKDEQMKAMIPQFQTAQYALSFSDSVSVYRAVPKDEAPDPFEDNGGNRIVIKMSGPGDDGILYRNFVTGRSLEEASLEDNKYIVADTATALTWKLSDDTREILGHTCKKAVTTTRRGAVVAWYAPDIPVPAGPDHFGGLPGTILSLVIDSGSVVYTAIRLQPSVAAKDLAPPTGKKPISHADFMKKMDDLYGPADSLGRRMITRQGP